MSTDPRDPSHDASAAVGPDDGRLRPAAVASDHGVSRAALDRATHGASSPTVDRARHGMLARLSWAASASALARGDREAFARHAGEAAVHVAATGDVDGAAAFAHLRAGLLGLLDDTDPHRSPRARPPAASRGPAAAFAEEVRRGPAPGDSARAELAVWWRFLRALVAELPDDHPLIELAADWDAVALDVVIAVLAAGAGGATAATIAGWTGRPLAAVAYAVDRGGALVASGVLGWGDGTAGEDTVRDDTVREGSMRDDTVRVNPVLWAACAGAPSPLEMAPGAAAEDAFIDAEAAVTDGVVVLLAPSRALARTEVRGWQPAPIAAPDAELGAIWAARDARWRGRPLVLELEGSPGPEAVEVLLTAPHVVVLADAGDGAWLAANLDAARTVQVVTVQPLPPSEAAARLARALGVPPESVRAGHLYAGDVEALIAAVDERGDEAIWALSSAMRARASTALGALALADETADLGPGLAATLERTRELFAGQAAWTSPPTAVLVPGEGALATRLAIELARERGATAAAVDLDGAFAWRNVTTALDVLRRHGGVLAVRGLERAAPVCVHALAYALPRAQVTTVIGVPPGTEVPATLRKVSATLTASAAGNTFP